MREYTDLFNEGRFKIIQTAKTRYVLDYVESDIAAYAMRRVALLGENELPYRLYNIKFMLTDINQIISSKHRLFLDVHGNMVRWKPTKFYPVTCHRIQARWETDIGNTAIRLHKVPTTFVVSDADYTYAQVVRIGGSYVLYTLCNDMRKPTRKKV